MKKLKKKFITIGITGLLLSSAILTGCGGDSYTAQDLQNAREKRARGEKLNKEDSFMLEGFDEWKAEQDQYADY